MADGVSFLSSQKAGLLRNLKYTFFIGNILIPYIQTTTLGGRDTDVNKNRKEA